MYADLVLEINEQMITQARALNVHLHKLEKLGTQFKVNKFTFSAHLADRTNKKIHHLVVTSHISKSMHFPSQLTQVHFKHMQQHKRCIGIVLTLLENISAPALEELLFIVKMAKKYQIGLFCCTLASSWNDLVSQQQMSSIMAILGASTQQQQVSRDLLHKLLNNNL